MIQLKYKDESNLCYCFNTLFKNNFRENFFLIFMDI